MSTNLQRVLIAVILIIGYVAIGYCGEVGKVINGLLGNFAVGWLTVDIAKAIIKD